MSTKKEPPLLNLNSRTSLLPYPILPASTSACVDILSTTPVRYSSFSIWKAISFSPALVTYMTFCISGLFSSSTSSNLRTSFEIIFVIMIPTPFLSSTSVPCAPVGSFVTVLLPYCAQSQSNWLWPAAKFVGIYL